MHLHYMQLHKYFCSHVFIIRGALIYVFLNEMLLLTTACSTFCDFLVLSLGLQLWAHAHWWT